MQIMKTTPSRTGKKSFLIVISFLILSMSASAISSYAATAREIDVSVDVALERFENTVEGSSEFLKMAKGLLVMPNVIKAGFFVGAEYGEGALLIDGKTVDYYNIAGGSFGLQMGAEKKDIIIAFMTEEALNNFRTSKGWEAGVDGNIAIINAGIGHRLDTRTIRDAIVAFVFDVKGLMADISLKGSKFTKMDKTN